MLDIAARAKMECGAVNVDRATTPSLTKHIRSFIDEANPWQYQLNSLERDERLLPGRPHTTEIMMWAWMFGAFSVAAVVNQIAIALCRRAHAATEPDPHQEPSPELQSGR